jgi:hypothetical protein
MISENYFNPGWAGDRRLKNLVMVMEWIPSVSKLALLTNMSKSMSDEQQVLFKRAFQYFDLWVCRLMHCTLFSNSLLVVLGGWHLGHGKLCAGFAHVCARRLG